MWAAWVSCWRSFFTSQSFQSSDNFNDFTNPLKIVTIRTSATVFKLGFLLSETLAKLSFCSIHFSHSYTNIPFVIFVMACCWVFTWSCSTGLTFRVSDLSWVPAFQSTTYSLYFFLLTCFALRSAKHPHGFYAFKCVWKYFDWMGTSHGSHWSCELICLSIFTNIVNLFYLILSAIVLCLLLGHCWKHWFVLRPLPITELSWSSPLKRPF